MILGLISNNSDGSRKPELVLVPDKPTALTVPVPVMQLRPTEFAVHLISNDEGITVQRSTEDEALIIEPTRPTKLYLTPNLPERPGFSVDKVKVLPVGQDDYRIWFDRDRGWEEWRPNVKLF